MKSGSRQSGKLMDKATLSSMLEDHGIMADAVQRVHEIPASISWYSDVRTRGVDYVIRFRNMSYHRARYYRYDKRLQRDVTAQDFERMVSELPGIEVVASITKDYLKAGTGFTSVRGRYNYTAVERATHSIYIRARG